MTTGERERETTPAMEQMTVEVTQEDTTERWEGGVRTSHDRVREGANMAMA